MATRQCTTCGEDLAGTRRAQVKYCSSPCRQQAYRARSGADTRIPVELRERDQWVAWRPVRRQGKATKMPINRNGEAASSTDPGTWSAYSVVRGQQRKGYVLTQDDGIVCIDLDGCLENGELADWAKSILDQLPSTFIEVSPSGTGLHVWGRGCVDRGRARKGVEVYSSGRYIAVTGERFGGSPCRLADVQAVVDVL